MSYVNWRRHLSELDQLVEEISMKNELTELELKVSLHQILRNDPEYNNSHLGVPSPIVAFLEFLFFRAEGPYSPQYSKYTRMISMIFSCSQPLRLLLDLNAPDAIGNMVLNRRGRLKFSIADNLELDLVLQSWNSFGLSPVNRRAVFEAVLHKASVSRQLALQNPTLIMRLFEVFPEFKGEYWPPALTIEILEKQQGLEAELPSHRRYRRIMEQQSRTGISLEEMIIQEESRVLPLQAKRNSFLAFLVKHLHQGRCQICSAGLVALERSPCTVHHIIPLSEGGDDIASNMLVVCKFHHTAIHEGLIGVIPGEQIEVRSDDSVFLLKPR